LFCAGAGAGAGAGADVTVDVDGNILFMLALPTAVAVVLASYVQMFYSSLLHALNQRCLSLLYWES
jgi:hypothetical protein